MLEEWAERVFDDKTVGGWVGGWLGVRVGAVSVRPVSGFGDVRAGMRVW
jgi:hypothetical protein